MEPSDDTKRVISALIDKLQARPSDAFDALTPELYERLRRLGKIYMSRERRDHTYQSTELVHEALARLNRRAATFSDTKHWYLTVAQTMRRILVDHARARRNRPKKYQTTDQLSVPGIEDTTQNDAQFLDLDAALSELERRDPELAEACALYYFGGHTVAEVALLLKVSESTITRRLRLMKAWLVMQVNHARTRTRDEP